MQIGHGVTPENTLLSCLRKFSDMFGSSSRWFQRLRDFVICVSRNYLRDQSWNSAVRMVKRNVLLNKNIDISNNLDIVSR
jgi:hypothetical protein